MFKVQSKNVVTYASFSHDDALPPPEGWGLNLKANVTVDKASQKLRIQRVSESSPIHFI